MWQAADTPLILALRRLRQTEEREKQSPIRCPKPVISALRKLRQEDCSKFKVSLGYLAIPWIKQNKMKLKYVQVTENDMCNDMEVRAK